MHWFLDPIQYHYANLEGRATREEFWMFVLIVAIISVGLGVLVSLTSEVMSALIGVFWLSILLPGIALGMRRLHDINKSGIWIFLPIIPGVACLVLLFLINIIFGLLAASISAVYLGPVCVIGSVIAGGILLFFLVQPTQGGVGTFETPVPH